MNDHNPASRSSEHGNIFFYIFLGIVLFAALGFAFSRTTISTKSISDEKARLYATEIINFGNQVKDGVIKLKLRGCTENQFDFQNSIYKRNDNSTIDVANPSSPSDDSCDLFSAAGAGLTPYIPSAEAFTKGDVTTGAWTPGHGGFRVVQINNVGTDGASGTVSANDLMFGMPYVSSQVCSKINQILSVTATNVAPINISAPGTGGFYAGTFAGTQVMSGTAINGKLAFCFSLGGAFGGQYVQVLLAR